MTALDGEHQVAGGGRFGCAFVRPSGAVTNLVQRYINRIEREQRALT